MVYVVLSNKLHLSGEVGEDTCSPLNPPLFQALAQAVASAWNPFSSHANPSLQCLFLWEALSVAQRILFCPLWVSHPMLRP